MVRHIDTSLSSNMVLIVDADVFKLFGVPNDLGGDGS